ncbi:MAG: response regulator transcription factor [Chloroflexi bacterium]|nr:response regulator transcription factor [Chloroflexota bacterium]
MKVLIIEDDREVAETVQMAFSVRWPESEVLVRDTGQGGVDVASTQPLDLTILDVNLPDQDGFAVLQAIRKFSQVPIIMLTVRASESDKVRGLQVGADDYLGKPFSPFELLARASAVLRRSRPGTVEDGHAVLKAGSITLNPDTIDVFVEQRPVKLSPTEFKILALLVSNAGKMVKRETIAREIWGTETPVGAPYLLKLHIQHLRQKLGDTGAESKFIVTVRGFGYKINA